MKQTDPNGDNEARLLQGTTMTHTKRPVRPADYDKKIGLVLQGGGALGGISIGGINAALIAGNAPENRVAQLRAFWQEITAPTACWPTGLPDPLGRWEREASGWTSLLFGQPGFFTPRPPRDWLDPAGLVNFYDTAPLKQSLERLVDFDRINDPRGMRLSVGAVNVGTGRFAYFDSEKTTIRPEHIMASGALPPGFPPVEIDGEFYWDGGLVSNTPLQYVLEYYPRRSRLCFQVDLFHAAGMLPASMDEVKERINDIRYSSRTRVNTDAFQQLHDIRHAIVELEKLLPGDIAGTEQAQRLHAFGCVTEMDIVQLIYRPLVLLGSAKDYEFSRGTMTERWAQGVSDAETTLAVSPWLAPNSADDGVRVFDVMHDILTGQAAAPAPPS
jgi:NTE family protein